MDESKFELFGNKSRGCVRIKIGEKRDDDCAIPTVKYGSGSVVVLVYLGGKRVGDLIQVKGIMKKRTISFDFAKTCNTIWFTHN